MTQTAQLEINNLNVRVTPAGVETVLRSSLSLAPTRFTPGGPLGYPSPTAMPQDRMLGGPEPSPN